MMNMRNGMYTLLVGLSLWGTACQNVVESHKGELIASLDNKPSEPRSSGELSVRSPLDSINMKIHNIVGDEALMNYFLKNPDNIQAIDTLFRDFTQPQQISYADVDYYRFHRYLATKGYLVLSTDQTSKIVEIEQTKEVVIDNAYILEFFPHAAGKSCSIYLYADQLGDVGRIGGTSFGDMIALPMKSKDVPAFIQNETAQVVFVSAFVSMPDANPVLTIEELDSPIRKIDVGELFSDFVSFCSALDEGRFDEYERLNKIVANPSGYPDTYRLTAHVYQIICTQLGIKSYQDLANKAKLFKDKYKQYMSFFLTEMNKKNNDFLAVQKTN